MGPTRSQLLSSATSLCNAFASKAPIPELLSHFSTRHLVSAREHGLPFLAPFLNTPYTHLTGPNSLTTYFSLLQKYLTYEEMSFGEWVIDTEVRKVCCKGQATFRWIEGVGNGEHWNERFIYMLDFDEEAKITDYQVWADSGAAYLARIGKLSELRKEYEKEQST